MKRRRYLDSPSKIRISRSKSSPENKKMEEEKAVAYYEELTRKGEGASRFKQGLGFSSSSSNGAVSAPSRGSALASNSSSSFLNSFVKASSPTKASEYEKQAQIDSIQNKLKKKKRDEAVENERKKSPPRVSRGREYRSRSRSRSRSRESYRSRDRDRERRRTRRKSRSGSGSPRRDRRSGRRRSRSLSPRERKRSEKGRSGDVERDKGKERNAEVDFSKLIEGYDRMTSAERVKARMKFQLHETAGKDKTKGIGWERFEFNKDAPLDDEEIEAGEDDAVLVKRIGQSFRFSALEARREEQIKAAHDEAMFGVSTLPTSTSPRGELRADNEKKESNRTDAIASLLSTKVLAKPQGSWRDRVRKV